MYNNYKTCIVPDCKSTTIKTPDKVFVSVPRILEIRRQWYKAMNRPDHDRPSMRTRWYCCEDHFDFKEDLDNYYQWKMQANVNKRLKKDVVPRFFDDCGKIFMTLKLLESSDAPSEAYIGLTKNHISEIRAINRDTSINTRDIILVLKKIKMNQPFSTLSSEFSLPESRLRAIFKSNVQKIAKYFEKFVIATSRHEDSLELPDVELNYFKLKVSKRSFVIDEESSRFDKYSTKKYLISVAVDGKINFVSKAMKSVKSANTLRRLLKNSDCIDNLPFKIKPLTACSFKKLDFNRNKPCKSIERDELPSVFKDARWTKSNVKRLLEASRRKIYAERVINQMRNFNLFDIHTRIDADLLEDLDSCVTIGAALTNLQNDTV